MIDIHRDGNIDWKCQISHVCSKTAKISSILCRTRHNLPGVFMQGLYYALIYGYLIYSEFMVTLHREIRTQQDWNQ